MARDRPTDASRNGEAAEELPVGGDPASSEESSTTLRRPASAGLADSPLHPFLFAAFSVFAPYAANLRETSFADVATSLVVVTATAALLFVVLGRMVGRYGPRAALLASILLAGTI